MLREPTALSGQGEDIKVEDSLPMRERGRRIMVLWILAFLAVALLFPPRQVIDARIWSSF